jgi:DNA-binding LacI/PurR family transcriptional regulator
MPKRFGFRGTVWQWAAAVKSKDQTSSALASPAMANKRIGLVDVAAEAGVSVTTASDALNGKGRLAVATRQRVREAAERLGYRPNVLARSLVGARTGLIAVAFSHTGDITAALADKDYLRQAVVALTGEALELEVGLVLGPPTRHPEMWSKIPVDGLIVFSPVRGDPLLPQIRSQGTPTVLIGRDPDGAHRDPCVDNDHLAGTRTVLDHLEARGAVRPGLLAVDLDDAFTDDCITGYRGWCADRSVEPRIVMVPAETPEREAAALIERALSGPEAPDALHTTVWEMGARVAETASRLGLRIPEDLMIVACGDTEPLPGELPITQLKLFPEVAALEAIELLMALIQATPSRSDREVPTELVVRTSTSTRIRR